MRDVRCGVAIALLIGLLGRGATAAIAAPELARSADAFVDSIGANTHYGNAIYVGGNAYANPAIDAKLAALGIRHLRDHTWNDTGLARIDGLHSAYGIRTNLILGETTRSPAELVGLLKAHPAYEAIEGLNEPDFNTRSYGGFTDNPAANDYSATRAFQNDLYAAIKADAQTQNRLVLSPAMGTAANSQFLPPISFDVAAMHYYSDGREPTFGLDTRIGQMATLRGSPAKPLMATESGYFNQPAAQTGSIPENISGKYLPRLYTEYFNRGIERTYLYELADQGPDLLDREQNFGLLRYDMTEKPAYVATKNLIGLLAEPGASFTPSSLDYGIVGGTAALHHTLLQKSDGTFYLLLWQELPGYNRFMETEIVNPPLSVTLTLNTDVALARTFLPNDSATAIASYLNPDSINLSVPDRMLVVELTTVPEPGVMGLLPLAWLAARRGQGRSAVTRRS
jgi:hypothetical protein